MPPEITPELQQMRAALDAANRRGSDAENRARQAQTELHQERGGRLQAQEFALDAQIRAAEDAQSSIEREFAELQAEGKLLEAGAAMRKMSDASAYAMQLRTHKQQLSQAREQVSNTPPVNQDPLANFNETEKAWINDNPQYLSDQAFQRKANAAALHASEILGLTKDSQEYYDHINRTMHPDRFGDGGDADQGGSEPLSINLDNRTTDRRQEHTLEASPVNRTQDPPAMRIDLGGSTDTPVRQNPYAPAAGRGAPGEAMRGVAAPPTRNIDMAARRAAGGGRPVIEPTHEEVQAAISLASSIEPDSEMVMHNDVPRMVEWYYALAHSPTHNSTRRRSWARDAIVG